MTAARAFCLATCVLGLALAPACQDACLQLATEVCACQPDSNAQAVCNQQAKQRESVFPVSPQDEKYCQQKLDTHLCDCSSSNDPSVTAACCGRLNTPEGRAACGLVLTGP